MVDVARLGLSVDSSQVEKGTVSLHQLTGAAGQASAAAQRLAGATTAEAAGHKAAATAAHAHNAALMAQNTVIRSSMQQRTMMIYQLNDVGVSLASGMNPMMVAIQQGSQILQGGFAPALRTITDLTVGLVSKFWPVAVAVGAVTATFAGLTYEINKTAESQVGVVDVMLAAWGMFADQVMAIVTPIWNALVEGLKWVWDTSAPILKAIGNTIIGTYAFAIKAIGALWNGLPAAVGDAVITTANVIIKGVEWSINGATRLLNGFLSKYNEGLASMGQKAIPLAGGISIPQASNPYQGALGNLGTDIGGAASEAYGTDYMGGLGGALSKRAQEIAAARKETEELGGAAKAANDNIKAMDDSAKSLAETWGGTLKSAWQGFFSDFNNGLKQGKGFWDALGDAGMNALDKITSKALEMATNGIWDMILGALGPTLGMGSFGIGGGMSGTSSITGSSGGFFPAFAGGGYTGDGTRSGGLDGQGGFLAMMHPQETVLDHTRGQAANGNSVSVVRIELSGDVEGRILQQGAKQSVQIVRAAAPSIAEQGAQGAGAKLAGGEFDGGMRRYGVQPQAKRR